MPVMGESEAIEDIPMAEGMLSTPMVTPATTSSFPPPLTVWYNTPAPTPAPAPPATVGSDSHSSTVLFNPLLRLLLLFPSSLLSSLGSNGGYLTEAVEGNGSESPVPPDDTDADAEEAEEGEGMLGAMVTALSTSSIRGEGGEKETQHDPNLPPYTLGG